jgi:hypothetical protein
LFVILSLFCPFQEKSLTSAKIISLFGQILKKNLDKLRKIDQMGCEMDDSQVIEKE